MPVRFSKKTVVLYCVMFFNCALVFCFDLSIGLKAGLGHFSFYGEDYERYKARAGLQYVRSELKAGFSSGLFAILGIIDPLAIQAEVFYTRGGDGQKAKYVLRHINANLWDIPIFLKGRLAIGPGVFGFFVGAEFILPFGEGYVNISTATSNNGDQNSFPFASMNPFQVGVVFGLDYGIPLGPGKIYFDLRSFWCLTPFHPTSHIEKNDVKASSILLMIGYGLDLIKPQEEVPQ